MIDWGLTPVGSIAHIYWPQVDATSVLSLARRLYGTTLLTASDAHTVDCRVTKGVTYVPIPAGTGESFAGLLTVDLPTTVTSGQEFDILVRRVSSRRQAVIEVAAPHQPEAPRIAPARAEVDAADSAAEGGADRADPGEAPRARAKRQASTRGSATRKRTSAAGAAPAARGRTSTRKRVSPAISPLRQEVTERIAAAPDAATTWKGPRTTNWRYVTGTFQVKIPVTTAEVMLWPDENTLAIVRWRLSRMATANRWHPVLTRYAEYLAARIDGLGGDSATIAPSPEGAPPRGGSRGSSHPHTGRVVDVTFDCDGELEGFAIEACCGGRHSFPAREPGVRDLVLRALKERLTLVVVTESETDDRVCRIHVRW